MNAIGGIFHRNNFPVSITHLKNMCLALAHRGPDGISSVSADNIGMINCRLYDTPESLLEKLPAKSSCGKLLITLSGRIDNRKELQAKTDWGHQLSITTDSDLVLAAYKKWGHNCIRYLLGDFAFAIWDNSIKKLFCARDHMGVKPFYYFLDKSLFAFSSEIKGLKALSINDGGVNEDRIADYLTCVIADNQSTFYNNIFRLPPGHYLEIDSNKHILCQYWEPHPRELSCHNNSDYEEQFYSIFKKAVQCRMRSAYPVGSFLSGGLDSSSIVSMASGPLRNQCNSQLHTFSGIFDKIKQCDERVFFDSVLDRYDIFPHYVYADKIDPQNIYDQISSSEDEPFWAPHFFMSWKIMALAKRSGIKVLLDGHDGDSTVSHGYGLLPELLIKGKLVHLFKECRVTGRSTSLKKTIRLFLKICQYRADYKTSLMFPTFFEDTNFTEIVNNLTSAFSKEIDIHKRLLRSKTNNSHMGMTEFTSHKLSISHPLHPEALEFFDRQSARHNVVSRYPFFDKRLIEFCLALPAEQKRANGFNRSIMRRSLASILPPTITNRKTKTDFMANVVHSFSNSNTNWLQFNIDRISDHAYNYINRDKLLQVFSSFSIAPKRISLADLGFLLRSISLDLWLNKK